MTESRGRRRQFVDPRGVHVLTEITKRAQEFAGYQYQVISQEQVYRTVLQSYSRIAVFLYFNLEFCFPQYLVIELIVEHRIEICGERAVAILGTDVVSRCISGKVRHCRSVLPFGRRFLSALSGLLSSCRFRTKRLHLGNGFAFFGLREFRTEYSQFFSHRFRLRLQRFDPGAMALPQSRSCNKEQHSEQRHRCCLSLLDSHISLLGFFRYQPCPKQARVPDQPSVHAKSKT
jgi:hypothetical protein